MCKIRGEAHGGDGNVMTKLGGILSGLEMKVVGSSVLSD